MTDTARDHLERAVAWLTDCDHELAGAKMHIATARAEVEHALWLLAIPPRGPTEKMLEAGGRSIIIGQETRPGSSWAEEAALAWRAMYDAALAEKEGK